MSTYRKDSQPGQGILGGCSPREASLESCSLGTLEGPHWEPCQHSRLVLGKRNTSTAPDHLLQSPRMKPQRLTRSQRMI